MHRAATAALVVLAVIVFSSAIYLVGHHDDVPQAGQLLPLPPSPSPSPSPSPAGSSRPGSPSSSSTRRLVVAFLGDDWTAGVGASGSAAQFPALICAALTCTARNFGIGGTGYLAAVSDLAGTYLSRIDTVVQAHPAVVVVSGGRNDELADDIGQIGDTPRNLFAQLQRQLPGAQLVAVRPFWGDSPAPDSLGTLAASVRSGVTAAGGTYLNVPDPLTGHPSWMASRADPNDRGYAAIAEALVTKLRPILSSATG